MAIAWVHALGRMFADELEKPDFEVFLERPFFNRNGIPGYSYYGYREGRRFCVSQSRQSEPDSTANLARVLGAKKATARIETRLGPFYRNHKNQVGLVVGAWDGSQWVQMFSPGTPDQPLDRFTRWMARVRDDRQFDPQITFFGDDDNGGSSPPGVQIEELEDILRHLRARRDFDW
jgi:hypothetical protein